MKISAKIVYFFLIFFCIVIIYRVSTASDEGGESEENDKQVWSESGELLSCGVERWAIKTCTDHDTINVNFNNVIPSSILYQRSLPSQTNLPPNNRLLLEDTVYSIDCKLTRYKLEDDGDVHCVISDANGLTMVTEICDPTCPGISSTSRYGQLTTLRNWFVSTYHPSTSWQYPNVYVRLTGVGFYDFAHGQIGMAPNNREIHPILTMTVITGIDPINNIIPFGYKLYQNFPNPFNPETKIKFEIPQSSVDNSGNVTISIFDIEGKEIKTLLNESLKPGTYEITFNGSNLASGLYFCRLSAGNFIDYKKMILLK